MSVICGQVRHFQLLAELRPLEILEVGPGADMGAERAGNQKPEMSASVGEDGTRTGASNSEGELFRRCLAAGLQETMKSHRRGLREA